MWVKFAQSQAKSQVTESLYEVKSGARTQQTTELMQVNSQSLNPKPKPLKYTLNLKSGQYRRAHLADHELMQVQFLGSGLAMVYVQPL
jgi:hypothetical protein